MMIKLILMFFLSILADNIVPINTLTVAESNLKIKVAIGMFFQISDGSTPSIILGDVNNNSVARAKTTSIPIVVIIPVSIANVLFIFLVVCLICRFTLPPTSPPIHATQPHSIEQIQLKQDKYMQFG